MSKCLPPKLNDGDLESAFGVIKFVTGSPLGESVASRLYYPIQQIPMISFQQDMISWEEDKLKLFKGSVNISPVQKSSEGEPSLQIKSTRSIKYKRLDDFTVIAIVLTNVQSCCVVFTNEVSQTSWEILGTFVLKDAINVIERSAFVDYPLIESSYTPQDRDSAKSEGDYWDLYDKNSDVETGKFDEEITKASTTGIAPKQSEEEDTSYWNQMATQSQQIGESGERTDLIDLFIGLSELYIDCGAISKQLIMEDLLDVSKGIEKTRIGIPLVAHRHAVRTLGWAIRENGNIQHELSKALEKLQKF